jgi:hypothetical protein
MSVELSISKPTLIDSFLINKVLVNRNGRFSFRERIVNGLRNLISLIKKLFLSFLQNTQNLGLEMVSTGTSKLERTIKPIWADDEQAIKETLRSGDIIVVMGRDIDPRVKIGQLLTQPLNGSVLSTDASHYCEHTCMYVKDSEGEWIVEDSPPWIENDRDNKPIKLLGDGARKVPFKEHRLFLHFLDAKTELAPLSNSHKKDLFLKIMRPADPKLAEESARIASQWSSVSKINLKTPAAEANTEVPPVVSESAKFDQFLLDFLNDDKNMQEVVQKYLIDPSKRLMNAAEDSLVRGYGYLKAGLSIFRTTLDSSSAKKEFLKWALLSSFPHNKGDDKLPSQFCSMFTTWTLRVAESRQLVTKLLEKHPEDVNLQFMAKVIANPDSSKAKLLKKNPRLFDFFVNDIYNTYKDEIDALTKIQLEPSGVTPSRFFDYAKGNPEVFKQVASIIPRNHPALPQPVGHRVQ